MTITTVSAATLINTWGVNSHADWSTAGWTNAAVVEASMKYVNAKHYRDVAPPWAAIQTEYGVFYSNTGATLHALMQEAAGSAAEINEVAAMLSAIPGSVGSVEGANEVNLNGISVSQANAGQTSLYNAVQANSTLAGLPVRCYSLSGGIAWTPYGNQSSHATRGNSHCYADATDSGNTNRYPETHMLSNYDQAKVAFPTQPIDFTEIGGSLGTDEAWAHDPSDAQRAINTVRAWLYMPIVSPGGLLFLYSLMDNSTSGTSEDTFGLFDSSGNPRAAATAVHNLMAVLADSGTVSGTPASTATVAGADYALGIVKSDGTQMVAVWNTSNTTQGTVTAGAVSPSMSVFSPFTNATTQTTVNTQTLGVTITPSPKLVIIAPAAAVVVPPPPVLTPSAFGTLIKAAGQSFVDAAGVAWSLVQGSGALGLQIAVSGVVDTTTTVVEALILLPGGVTQLNTAGNAYSRVNAAAAWVQASADVAELLSLVVEGATAVPAPVTVPRSIALNLDGMTVASQSATVTLTLTQ